MTENNEGMSFHLLWKNRVARRVCVCVTVWLVCACVYGCLCVTVRQTDRTKARVHIGIIHHMAVRHL